MYILFIFFLFFEVVGLGRGVGVTKEEKRISEHFFLFLFEKVKNYIHRLYTW